jgi:uncharacterized iron-regulated membrane protein
MSICADALASSTAPAAVRRLFWRVHFWAGLVTAPLVLFAAFTGLLYVFTPQIEARVHAGVDRVAVAGPALPLDAQIDAASAAQAGWTLRSITPAFAPGETTQVLFSPPPAAHAQHAQVDARTDHGHGLPTGRTVYIDPATARVVGSLGEMERFKTWAKKLHSSALQGDAWRWPIELAASWLLLMFATGIAMWWPQRSLRVRPGRGRLTWRDLHTGVGVVMSGLLAVVLVTGLTWSRHAGDHFRTAQAALGQASPKPPAALRSLPGDAAPLSAQAVLQRAQVELPGRRLQMTPPHGPDGVWRAEVLVGGRPADRMALALDARSGQVLWRSGWHELPALAQATAIGIPFHRGEFGVWNQAVLALAALAAIFSVVSGIGMWWLRRPARCIGAPRVTRREWAAVPRWLWGLTAALCWALPVFGLSVLAFIALELIAASLRRIAFTASA